MAEGERDLRGGDAGGLYAVLIIVVILILAAVLYFSGALDGGTPKDPTDADVDVELETPAGAGGE